MIDISCEQKTMEQMGVNNRPFVDWKKESDITLNEPNVCLHDYCGHDWDGGYWADWDGEKVVFGGFWCHVPHMTTSIDYLKYFKEMDETLDFSDWSIPCKEAFDKLNELVQYHTQKYGGHEASEHGYWIVTAISKNKPVNIKAAEAYGIEIPSNWIRDDENYIPQK